MSLLQVSVPGIVHDFEESDDDRRICRLMHPDGSWARAEALGHEAPVVHQAGPQRLWDVLDELRDEWLRNGYFQLYGARAFVAHDGSVLLTRGSWKAVIR
jgi:hypothetical protein